MASIENEIKKRHNAELSYKSYKSSNSSSNTYVDTSSNRVVFGLATRILGVVTLLMVVIGMYRLANGGSLPLFTDLLNLLSGAPTVQIPFLGTIFSDWVGSANLGIFSFIKYIASAFGFVVDMIVFIFNGMLSIYTYLYYFIRWIIVA